jgi:hypothetical protein
MKKLSDIYRLILEEEKPPEEVEDLEMVDMVGMEMMIKDGFLCLHQRIGKDQILNGIETY